ncbi:MAG TPA: hypothetical protein VGN23_10880 [Verrucomicrobiae bacterium]
MITTKADDQKRIQVPLAKPGQVYAIQQNADGGFTLSVVQAQGAVNPKCRIVKEDGFTVVAPSQPIDELAIKELLADFP